MKILIAIIFSISLSFGGLYDYPYSATADNKIDTKSDKYLMYGDFDKIYRFEPIYFKPSSNKIKSESQDYLDEIVKKYKNYKDKGRDITFTIIGYTDHVQTKIEKVNQSWWFPRYTNNLTKESSKKLALSYAKYTFDELVKKGIPKELIIVEQRAGLDNLYTRASTKGRELNYRAMVSMYVSKDKYADSDNDGVIDSKDKCSFTPQGHKVDKEGCSEMLNLTIYYNLDSSVIRNDSFKKLTKMIEFINKYPHYNIFLYGHTSSEASTLHNQLLSEKRALSIRNYMITQGIDSARIYIFGRGELEPVQKENEEEVKELNRRVEVKLR